MAPKISPGQIPTLTVGGRTLTDLANLIELTCSAAGTGALNASFRLPGGSAGYAVPVGKTLRIVGYRAKNTSTTTGAVPVGTLFYSDNDMGNGSATAATNPVYRGGAANSSSLGNLAQVAQPGLSVYEEALSFDVPTGKYVSFIAVPTATVVQVTLYGYLV